MRCTGECCRRFPLRTDDLGYLDQAKLEEVARVDGHAAYLLKFVQPEPPRDDGVPQFSCIAWDPQTKRCTKYEERPNMCRTYPYGMECPFCGSRTDLEARTDSDLIAELKTLTF